MPLTLYKKGACWVLCICTNYTTDLWLKYRAGSLSKWVEAWDDDIISGSWREKLPLSQPFCKCYDGSSIFLPKKVEKEFGRITYIPFIYFLSTSDATLHTDTWVYKKSKHEFCVLASKHALWCKNRSSLNKNCHWWWKSTQIELFWDLFYKFNTSLHGDFTVENQVFQCIN